MINLLIVKFLACLEKIERFSDR